MQLLPSVPSIMVQLECALSMSCFKAHKENTLHQMLVGILDILIYFRLDDATSIWDAVGMGFKTVSYLCTSLLD